MSENAETAPHFEQGRVPLPVARRLVAAFGLLVLLTLVTQVLSLYNSGRLSASISTRRETDRSLDLLSAAYSEIVLEARLARERALRGDAPQDAVPGNAEKLLDALEERSYPEIRLELRTALHAVRGRAKDGRITAEESVEEFEELRAARDHLTEALLAERSSSGPVRAEMEAQARFLDISFAVIMCAMVLSGILLAFVWKGLVDLH